MKDDIKACEECGTEDFFCFMVERILDKNELVYFCRDCDPGEERAPDKVDYYMSQKKGE